MLPSGRSRDTCGQLTLCATCLKNYLVAPPYDGIILLDLKVPLHTPFNGCPGGRTVILEHGHQLQGKDIAFLSGVEGMSTLNPLRGSRSQSHTSAPAT